MSVVCKELLQSSSDMIGKFSCSYIDLDIFIVLKILVWIKETTVNIGRHNQVTLNKTNKQKIPYFKY